jgi:hypothetical protein
MGAILQLVAGCAPSPTGTPSDAASEAARDAASDDDVPVAVDAATDVRSSDTGESPDGATSTRSWVTAPVMAPGVSQIRFMSAAARAMVRSLGTTATPCDEATSRR